MEDRARNNWLSTLWPLLLVWVAMLGFGTNAYAQGPAGKVSYVRGAVSIHSGSVAGLAGVDSALKAGDVITTGPASVAVLELSDNSRIVLRPNTVFTVEAFETREGNELGLMRLFRGGMRAVTGFLSKRNPNAVRLQTPVATIGIRGTEFDARLCDGDCNSDDAQATGVAQANPASAVGQLSFVRGKVTIRRRSGDLVSARAGVRVQNGDLIESEVRSFAVLVFADNTRMTVTANTAFRVEDVRHDEARAAENRGFFSLFRGGLRIVTGAISRLNRRDFQVQTPVATIGIRGTKFDLQCVGSCVAGNGNGDGLGVEVQEGSVDFDGQNPIAGGQAVFLTTPGTPPQPANGLPLPFSEPPPSDVPDTQLGAVGNNQPSPSEIGLFVSCYEGNCRVETETGTVDLSAGQAAFAGSVTESPERLPAIPAFQSEDPFLGALTQDRELSPHLLDDPVKQGEFSCQI